MDGSTTPPTNPGETVKNTGVVTATSLNVRSGYGSSYSKNRNIIKWSKSRNSRK
ncbi:hypothetical protein Q5M85_15545 [Paraclostridium bifermentans]|nr:hypothetical protein [Paraclostridium bifermentans]